MPRFEKSDYAKWIVEYSINPDELLDTQIVLIIIEKKDLISIYMHQSND